MDEQQAIQRLKGGEIGGLELLVSRQARAVRAAYVITRDPGLAEDVVQDCFLQVHRSIQRFDETRSFAPWFMRSTADAPLFSLITQLLVAQSYPSLER